MARKPEPELTDAKWAALEPLLPPQRPPTGRPNNDHRQVVEAMVWLARTGAPWRDLPAHYGSWKTVASRFYRWRRDGIFSDCWARSTAAPMPAASWTGCATTSTAAWSAPTSTPPAPTTPPPVRT